MAEIRGVLGNSSPIHLNPGMRNQQPPGGQRPLLTEPVLSPILTDTEISPLHRTGMGSAPGKNEPQFTNDFLNAFVVMSSAYPCMHYMCMCKTLVY